MSSRIRIEKKTSRELSKIVVVGGGPSAMMAAIRSSQLGQSVTLLEKNPTLGKKLLLSGKGRCNLTNACSLEEFLERFSKSGPFLRDAFKIFFNQELMDFFEVRGLKLKIERQKRVFPVTDEADSILRVLKKELLENKIKIIYNTAVNDIVIKSDKFLVNSILADKVILATGGISYGFTGSTGQGMKIAKALGHRITPLRPGLVALDIKKNYSKFLEGLTLKNIRLRFTDGKKEILSDIGELLFTKTGISGPLVLSLSGKIVDWLDKKGRVYLEIDLKPALSLEKLETRLLREFKESPKKALKNTLKSLLPMRLIDVFLDIAGLLPDKKVNQVTQDERKRIAMLLKALRFEIKGSRPIKEAMVTRGGVSLKDIDPRTMQSRIIKGLYFAGEIIDIDADTGGFNLQAAFSTGYLAGQTLP
ncbi:MAG: NAD(P)/FAD-dependent oxidoreductase [Candidatus Gorgyraea atricola]|nr:NAD(P)/FAD-dependent oxidoreductase [Candidatus Gorgyraea atricola]